MRSTCFLITFKDRYSYGPDGKLDAIHKKIKEDSPIVNFPIDEVSRYIEERTGMTYVFSEKMLASSNSTPPLNS